MRRLVAITAGLAVLGGASYGASAAIGGGAPSNSAASVASNPRVIAESLADSAVRARYQLPAGNLVSATVCVRSNCATKKFAPAPSCQSSTATCIDTALVARKYANGLTITVEVA